MYEHVDQSWRDQPRVMSRQVRSKLATRLAEYVESEDLRAIVVVFHGGEPLLAGATVLAEFAAEIRATVRPETGVDFSMQTNGVLLDGDALDTLQQACIGVSLSIDGPRDVNDRHRLTVRGRSSFDATMRAFELLESRPEQFVGVIAVIDPVVSGERLLKFFEAYGPPAIDFLLPDANHLRPPPGRETEPTLYLDWLIATFDAWFDRYAHLPVRTFDQLLRGAAGLPSRTDAFGLGDVSLLTIETDGSYHDLDVLKITEAGGTAVGSGVYEASINEAASSERIARHRTLLTPSGLSPQCRVCPEVALCGGGSVPHRFAGDGFGNPTVYCNEMLGLIRHVRRRLASQLAVERATAEASHPRPVIDRDYDCAEASATWVAELVEAWAADGIVDFRSAVESTRGADVDGTFSLIESPEARAAHLAIAPEVVLWTRVALQARRGVVTRSLDGDVLRSDLDLLDRLQALSAQRSTFEWSVHRDEPWLRKPFGYPIVFDDDPAVVEHGRELVLEALDLIREYSPALATEMRLLSREVQFVRDVDADPDKCVSFSDDVLPGVLYVSLHSGAGMIAVTDLADSLVHEHRHQKLYLLQRALPLVERDLPLVRSPWRQDPRPPSGLLHAAFVFVELRRFWRFVAATRPDEQRRAESEIAVNDARLREAWTILDGVPLTAAGRRLVRELECAHARS
jgi:uncharacterized protein